MQTKTQQDTLRLELITTEDGDFRTDIYLNGEYIDCPVTLKFGKKGEYVTAEVEGRVIEEVRICSPGYHYDAE